MIEVGQSVTVSCSHGPGRAAVVVEDRGDQTLTVRFRRHSRLVANHGAWAPLPVQVSRCRVAPLDVHALTVYARTMANYVATVREAKKTETRRERELQEDPEYRDRVALEAADELLLQVELANLDEITIKPRSRLIRKLKRALENEELPCPKSLDSNEVVISAIFTLQESILYRCRMRFERRYGCTLAKPERVCACGEPAHCGNCACCVSSGSGSKSE